MTTRRYCGIVRTTSILLTCAFLGCNKSSPNPDVNAMAIEKPPELSLVESQLNLGQLHQTQGKQSVEIVLRNSSDKPGKLRSIQTSCGCMVAGINSADIQPRSDLKIPFQIDPKDVGEHATQINFFADHGTVLSARVRWSTVSGLEVHPRELHFGGVLVGSEVTNTLSVKVSDENAENCVTATCTPGEHLRVSAVVDGTAIVTVLPSATIGIRQGVVVFRNSATSEVARIPVNWSVVPCVSVEPPSILLNSGSVSRDFVIRFRSGVIQDVEIGNSISTYFDAVIEQPVDKLNEGTVRCRIKITKKSNPGRFAGEVPLRVITASEEVHMAKFAIAMF